MKVENEMQKGLADIYHEGFEEVISLLQEWDAEYHTLVVKYEERRQHVMNWRDDHFPLAPQMLGWNPLWPDSDAELDDCPEEDPEEKPPRGHAHR